MTAQEEFNNFSTTKRHESRAELNVPHATSSNTSEQVSQPKTTEKKNKKGTKNNEMDTTL